MCGRKSVASKLVTRHRFAPSVFGASAQRLAATSPAQRPGRRNLRDRPSLTRSRGRTSWRFSGSIVGDHGRLAGTIVGRLVSITIRSGHLCLRMKPDDGPIDLARGPASRASCGKYQSAQEQQCEQQAADKDEISTEGHASSPLLTITKPVPSTGYIAQWFRTRPGRITAGRCPLAAMCREKVAMNSIGLICREKRMAAADVAAISPLRGHGASIC